jgi:hypothetical protein
MVILLTRRTHARRRLLSTSHEKQAAFAPLAYPLSRMCGMRPSLPVAAESLSRTYGMNPNLRGYEDPIFRPSPE